MIKGLYETHLNVSNLESSVEFYTQKLGLELASIDQERRIAFLWIGDRLQNMLGLWERPEKIVQMHFAFECDPKWVLDHSVPHLKSLGLTPYNFLKDGSEQPMVFVWMPAIAIYFKDPDDHVLEYIGVLDGKPDPAGGVLSFDDWLKTQGS